MIQTGMFRAIQTGMFRAFQGQTELTIRLQDYTGPLGIFLMKE